MDLKKEASKTLYLLSLELDLLNTEGLIDANALALANAARGIRYRLVDFTKTRPESASASCFLTKDGVLEINLGAATTIFKLVEADLLAKGMCKKVQFRKALSLFVLHETFHIFQGFIEYEKVSAIKETAGKSELAKLDLVADCAAARLLAWIESQREQDEYINHLFANLSISLSLCTMAFPFGPDAKHKVERAVSLFCVRQALLSGSTDPSEYGKARHYRFSSKMSILTVWVIESDASDYMVGTWVLTLNSGDEIAKATAEGDLAKLLELLSFVGVF